MDRRVQRTKKRIADAFLTLRLQKPLEKITVKELADVAEINKATFYLHFHDIYELNELCEGEIIREVLQKVPCPDNVMEDPSGYMEELTKAFFSQQKVYRAVFSDNRSIYFPMRLETEVKRFLMERFPEYRGDVKMDIILTLLIHGSFLVCLKSQEPGNEYDLNMAEAVLADCISALLQ